MLLLLWCCCLFIVDHVEYIWLYILCELYIIRLFIIPLSINLTFNIITIHRSINEIYICFLCALYHSDRMRFGRLWRRRNRLCHLNEERKNLLIIEIKDVGVGRRYIQCVSIWNGKKKRNA